MKVTKNLLKAMYIGGLCLTVFSGKIFIEGINYMVNGEPKIIQSYNGFKEETRKTKEDLYDLLIRNPVSPNTLDEARNLILRKGNLENMMKKLENSSEFKREDDERTFKLTWVYGSNNLLFFASAFFTLISGLEYKSRKEKEKKKTVSYN